MASESISRIWMFLDDALADEARRSKESSVERQRVSNRVLLLLKEVALLVQVEGGDVTAADAMMDVLSLLLVVVAAV